MKRYLFLIILIVSTSALPVVSQTNVAPVVGADRFHTFIEEGSERDYSLESEDDTQIVPLYGVAVQQQFTSRLSGTLSFMHSSKEFKTRIFGFAGYTYDDNKIWRHDYSLWLQYDVWKGIHIGVGGTYSQLKLKSYFNQGVIPPTKSDAVWVGGSLAYKYKKFWLELRYNDCAQTMRKSGEYFFFRSLPTSTTLTLRYLFQVLPLKNRRKEKCPEF